MIRILRTFSLNENDQGFLSSGELRTCYELIYVEHGTLYSTADAQSLILNRGDMILYGPNQWRAQAAPAGAQIRFLSIAFDAEGVELSGLTDRKLHLSQSAASLLQQMLAEKERMDPGVDDMILSLLTQLLITLQRADCASEELLHPSLCTNSENKIVCKAQQYIIRNIQKKLSVTLVADSVAVSTSYLTTLFHKHLHISPGKYIRNVKLQESKRMIRQSNMNLTEIANVLQFSSIHYFSRQFKEKFGISPSEYAKSIRGS